MVRTNKFLGSAAFVALISSISVGVTSALAQESGTSPPDQAQSGEQTTSPASDAPAASGQTPAASGDQAGTSQGQSGEDRLVATVNDVEIRQSDIVNAIESLPPQVQQMPPQMLLPIVVDQLLTRELILERASTENLQDDPAVIAIVEPQMQALRDQAVVNVWLERELAERITEARLNEAFEAYQAANPNSTETLVVLRPQLEQALRQEAMRELSAELRDGATIVFFDATGDPLPENASGQAGAAAGGNSAAGQNDAAGTADPATAGQGSGTENPANAEPPQNN